MPPIIRRPVGIPAWQKLIALVIGVGSGLYIWKPLLEKYVGYDKVRAAEQLAKNNKEN